MGVNTGAGGARICSTQCCGVTPDYICETSPGDASLSIAPSVASCPHVDYSAKYQADHPNHTDDLEITLSGGDAFYDPVLGTYTIDFQVASGNACGDTIFFESTYRDDREPRTCTETLVNCTDPSVQAETEFPVVKYRLYAQVNPRGGLTHGATIQLELQFWFCDSSDISRCFVVLFYGSKGSDPYGNLDCEENYTASNYDWCLGQINQQVGIEQPAITITSRAGTRTNNVQLTSLSSQTLLRKDLTRAIFCGDTPTYSNWKLKAFSNSTEVGSVDMPDPWTDAGGGYYRHPDVTMTLSGTWNGTRTLRLYWSTYEVASFTAPCSVDIPSPTPSGTVIQFKPPRFRFTTNTSGITVISGLTGPGALANKVMLTQEITSVDPHIIVRNSGGTEIEDCGSGAFTEEDFSGNIVAKTGVDIVVTGSIGTGSDIARIEYDDGTDTYQLSNALGDGNEACNWWYPAKYLEAGF